MLIKLRCACSHCWQGARPRLRGAWYSHWQPPSFLPWLAQAWASPCHWLQSLGCLQQGVCKQLPVTGGMGPGKLLPAATEPRAACSLLAACCEQPCPPSFPLPPLPSPLLPTSPILQDCRGSLCLPIRIWGRGGGCCSEPEIAEPTISHRKCLILHLF